MLVGSLVKTQRYRDEGVPKYVSGTELNLPPGLTSGACDIDGEISLWWVLLLLCGRRRCLSRSLEPVHLLSSVVDRNQARGQLQLKAAKAVALSVSLSITQSPVSCLGKPIDSWPAVLSVILARPDASVPGLRGALQVKKLIRLQGADRMLRL
jgi:hypothetical protein